MGNVRWWFLAVALGMGCLLTFQNASAAPQAPPSQPAPDQAQPPPGQAQAPAPAVPAPAPAADIGRLRVYRARRYAGSALAPSIYVDNKQVARVGSGRRVSIRLSPGSHTIRSDDKPSNIALDVKSGQDYYVRVDEEVGFWKGHGKLTLMMPEQGGPEYKLQRPIEDDRKIAREMIEEDTEPVEKKQDNKEKKD
jgi:Protein of unknown function (DUF2846)